jgi:hypothetical protein
MVILHVEGCEGADVQKKLFIKQDETNEVLLHEATNST